MKKFLISLIAINIGLVAGGAAMADKFTSCGPGYILVSHSDIDGIDAAECQKLWCRDLENGKSMGNGDRANSGYKETSYPMELCDANNNCVECFGDRRWCSGETPGYWNPEYGAYTYDGRMANGFARLKVLIHRAVISPVFAEPVGHCVVQSDDKKSSNWTIFYFQSFICFSGFLWYNTQDIERMATVKGIQICQVRN